MKTPSSGAPYTAWWFAVTRLDWHGGTFEHFHTASNSQYGLDLRRFATFLGVVVLQKEL